MTTVTDLPFVGVGIEMPDWTEAACRGLGADLFFPERGEPSEQIKAVCDGCPIKDACLEFALANDEEFGVWGGTSARERKRMRRHAGMRRLRPINHGSLSGAQAHYRRGEQPCFRCLETHNAENAEKKKRAKLRAAQR